MSEAGATAMKRPPSGIDTAIPGPSNCEASSGRWADAGVGPVMTKTTRVLSASDGSLSKSDDPLARSTTADVIAMSPLQVISAGRTIRLWLNLMKIIDCTSTT